MRVAIKMYNFHEFTKYIPATIALVHKHGMSAASLALCSFHCIAVEEYENKGETLYRIIGHVGLEWCEKSATWHLQSLVVDRKRTRKPGDRNTTYVYRKRGIGKTMVEKVLGFLDEIQSHALIYVATMPKNIGFFEKLGFQRDDDAKAAKEENPVLGRPKHKFHTILRK